MLELSKKMRYHQAQGHFRHFTTQLRESSQNNQDCQTLCLFRQLILQAASLSQNPDSQKSRIHKNGNKQGHRNQPKSCFMCRACQMQGLVTQLNRGARHSCACSGLMMMAGILRIFVQITTISYLKHAVKKKMLEITPSD